MKKAVCSALLVIIVLYITTIYPCFVSADSIYTDGFNYEKAVDLKLLGLFMGNGTNFDLNRAPTRAEGANMLVRLLGKDKEAKEQKFEHPFTDVESWASAQVGFMYKNGLTLGLGPTTFGAKGELSVQQYVTFVLRALGYSEKNGDFTAAEALEKAVQVGLLKSSEAAVLKDKSVFLRDDLVGISYNALSLKLKSSNRTLLDKLVLEDKAVSKVSAGILGLYTSEEASEFSNIAAYKATSSSTGYIVKNSTDFFKVLRKSLYLNETQVNIDIKSYKGNPLEDFSKVFDRASAAVSKSTGVENFIKSWKYLCKDSLLQLTFTYRYPKNEFEEMKRQVEETVFKARHIILESIKPNMSEYDKEMAIHNYIINNSRYDYDNYLSGKLPAASFSPYGCLVLGMAVCQGYAEATKLLCDLAGLECIVVGGETITQGSWEGHSWNIVKIDGKYYHLDLTFDDPVSEKREDILSYYHFNLPDSEMDKLYRWKKSDYPACTSIENNYYYKNRLVIDLADFENSVLKAIGQKKTQIVLKIKDYSNGDISNPTKIVSKSGAVSGFKYSINEKFGIVSITNIKYW